MDEFGINDPDKSKFTADQIERLAKGDWMKEFTRWDLDADLKQDQANTSAQQEAYMIKQKEQRCGIIIWTTLLQVLYAMVYVFMIYTRFDITKSFFLSTDYEQILMNFKTNLQTDIAVLGDCIEE